MGSICYKCGLSLDGISIIIFLMVIKAPSTIKKRTFKNEKAGFECPDGPIGLHANATPLINKDNEIKGLIMTFMDVASYKQAEGSLAEMSRISVILLEKSPNPISVVNTDTSILYVNPAMEKLTGFSREEIIGQKAPYPWWPEENVPVLNKSLQKNLTQVLSCCEKCFQRKDGEKFWVEITSTPVKINDEVKYLFSSLVDITEKRRMRDEMEFYVREITRIQEEERKRIARELHDDTAQSLAYLALELDSLLHNHEVTSEKVVLRLSSLKKQVDISLKEVRRFSHELRPGVLDQLGLIAALELLADELNARNQVQVKFNASGPERRLSNEEEQALFRIAQEALSNIRKHAQATQAEIDIQFSRNKVRLTITDNGKGFPLSEVDNAVAKGRLGLIGIKERARLIGGTLSLKSAPNKGTQITVALANT